MRLISWEARPFYDFGAANRLHRTSQAFQYIAYMISSKGSWKLSFFSAEVELGLMNMPAGLLAKYIRFGELMEDFGPHLGMPHTRSMDGGLFELRLKSHEGIARVFFCTLPERQIVFLHHFIKKSAKTPPRELELARKRLRITKNV